MAQPTEAATPKAIIERYLLAFDTICAERGTTANDIVASLSVSDAIISQLRAGRIKTLRADYVAEICLKYGYNIIWMLTGEGDMKADNETLSMQQDIARLKKDVAKVLELQKDVIGPLINEILGIKVGPSDVKGKLISEVKKHTKLNS